MDTAIRTLRPETSKRGRPKAPQHPSSAGSSQRDLNDPTPKELGLPSLKGGMLSNYNRKRSPNWWQLKDKERGKAHEKGTKGKSSDLEWEPQVNTH